MTGQVAIRLDKPGKGVVIGYSGVLLLREAGHLLVHARWERERQELDYLDFETGDHLFEHFYTDRWFNIFEVRRESGELKGWYCNVTRPARIEGDTIVSEDLELDLFVAADRRRVLTLDMDEFERRFAAASPTREAAQAALAELREMAVTGAPPFDSTPGRLSLGRPGVPA